MKIQYSKIVHILSLVVFCLVLVYSLASNGDGLYNTVIYTTAISISGTIHGLTVIWYLKKSQVENTYKLLCLLSETISNQEIKSTRSKLELKREFSITDLELQEISGASSLDEFKERIDNINQNKLDNAMDDATSPIEMTSFQQL